MTILTSASIKPFVDAAVADARDLPDLVAKLQVIDPSLSQQILGKALLLTKSPIGTLAVAAVAYVASRFGFGWDANTVGIVAGAGVLLGGYAMRLVTHAPITSLLPTPSLPLLPPSSPPAPPSAAVAA